MGIRRSFRPTNIVTNGNFANGTTGWTKSASMGVISVADNIATVVGNGVNNYPAIFNNTAINAAPNKKVYYRCNMLSMSAYATDLRLGLFSVAGSPGGYYQLGSAPTNGVWYTLSFIGTGDGAASGIMRIEPTFIYGTAEHANNAEGMVKEVLAIDLTALFGAGNEPTTAWCNANIPVWFDGTLSGGRIGGIGGLH